MTSIKQYSFYGCLSLHSISIPANITYINGRAFHNCSSLKTIYVVSNNKNFMDISGVLYSKNGETVTLFFFPCGKNGSFSIPSGVKEITNYAFYGCSELTSVIIPSSVTKINNNAFFNCSNLEFVMYEGTSDPGSSYAFTSRDKLMKINVPMEYSSNKFCSFDVVKQTKTQKRNLCVTCKSKRYRSLNIFVVLLRFATN